MQRHRLLMTSSHDLGHERRYGSPKARCSYHCSDWAGKTSVKGALVKEACSPLTIDEMQNIIRTQGFFRVKHGRLVDRWMVDHRRHVGIR